MNIQNTYNPFIFSKNSIHIIPATCIGLLIIFTTWYINKRVQSIISNLGSIHKLDATFIGAIKYLIRLITYSIGATLFLENFHIQISAIFGSLGVIAIGVGFALQKYLANMTSGMFLLFYKPFSIGDYIISEQPKFEGEIIDVNLRLTTLKYKGNIVLVPNHTLYSAIVTVEKNDVQ